MVWLRRVAFSLMGLLVVVMITATVAEKVWSTEVAMQWFYHAPWTIALWGVASVTGLVYFVRRMWGGNWKGVLKTLPTWGIHFAFVVILAGAGITHWMGISGKVHLRVGETTRCYEAEGKNALLPFELKLEEFNVTYYPGTAAAMDYVSVVRVDDKGRETTGSVSMNKIFKYRGWRFYQSRYDSDKKGTTLTVSYDPWGIGITYGGYLLLLVSMVGFLVQLRIKG